MANYTSTWHYYYAFTTITATTSHFLTFDDDEVLMRIRFLSLSKDGTSLEKWSPLATHYLNAHIS